MTVRHQGGDVRGFAEDFIPVLESALGPQPHQSSSGSMGMCNVARAQRAVKYCGDPPASGGESNSQWHSGYSALAFYAKMDGK